jgi:hypothetical protein
MTTISITTDAPADPVTVTEYGDALPELVRALNHVTLHHEAMEYPSDAARLLRNLAIVAGGLPQLLGHVAQWLAAEQAEGRIGTHGSPFRAPLHDVEAATAYVKQAQACARMLRSALDGAAEATSRMTGGDDG